MTDHRTERAAATWLGNLLGDVTVAFRKDGGVGPDVFLLVQRHPQTGESLDEPLSMYVKPQVIGDEGFGPEVRDHFAHIVRQICAHYDALGYLMIVEAWTVMAEDDVQWAEFIAWRERNPDGDLEDAPYAKETVAAFFEHGAVGTQIWQAEIVRAGGGVTLAEFTRVDVDAGIPGGRFVSMLPDSAYGATTPGGNAEA